MGAGLEEGSWFGRVARRTAGVDRKSAQGDWPVLSSWGGPPIEYPAFELADAMEQGMSRELESVFLGAPRGGMTRRMTVKRSKDKSEYLLVDDQEETLLVARRAEGKGCINIFVAGPTGTRGAGDDPAFRLLHGEGGLDWELRCSRDSSRGRVLMRAFHEKVKIGPADAMTMRVELPAEGAGAAASSWRDGPRLASRRPAWSNSRGSLTMHFGGGCRVKQASARNFQLTAGAGNADAGGAAGEAGKKGVLTYGRMEPGVFCLDFEAPLGAVQALAAALSTELWR